MFFQLYRTMDSTEMMHSDICGYMVFAFIPLSFGDRSIVGQLQLSSFCFCGLSNFKADE
ncbi:uncharacterized protein LOC111073646 isoform X6 [Drosophila obscura]|uniref:uncharacterized protein LOC111073646 isoform X6 n=1 Tax=Drosophila obscura TaxID=7282 RepID=UPI001BB1D864|nr:uncharacterized protein LOC111073646 isoform X6 [Drosophila obscura]